MFTRREDNELGSGDVWLRDSAVVVHFGSPAGTEFVGPKVDVVKPKWWKRSAWWKRSVL